VATLCTHRNQGGAGLDHIIVTHRCASPFEACVWDRLLTAMMFDSTKWPRRDTPWRRAPPKFGIPVGGFLHCIVFLGIARDVLILVSRSLLCSGSCHCSPQQTRFFLKNQRIVARTVRWSVVRCVGEKFWGCFGPFWARKSTEKTPQQEHFERKKRWKSRKKSPKIRNKSNCNRYHQVSLDWAGGKPRASANSLFPELLRVRFVGWWPKGLYMPM